MNVEKKPNLLIFMTDHQRWDMAPPFKRAFTPNLDRFAKEAAIFTEAYCPAPHCCPSRATFFTGLYPTEHGVWNNVEVGNTLSRGLYDNTRLWSDDLREAGYRLFYTGKWHVSAEETPADRGWEMTYPVYECKKSEGHRIPPDPYEWEKYYGQPGICKGEEPRMEAQIIRPGYPLYVQYGERENPFNDGTVVENAVRTILQREASEKPWCHFVGTLGPHDPYYVPKRFLDMYNIEDIKLPEDFYDSMENKPALYRRTKDRYSQLTEMEHRKSILHYLAFCTYEDHLFGELLKALEQKGELEDTIVIYTSDHGDYVGEHGLWAKGLPCFNSAYHIPLLIRRPGSGGIKGEQINHFVTLADMAPTILEMLEIRADRSFSGYSLVPLLEGQKPVNWRSEIYTQTNGNELYGIQRSVMTKEWKYVYNGFDYDELYHLTEDPHQMYNLIGDPRYDGVVREMCMKLWRFAYEHKDVCINPYIMVAHAPYGPGIIFEENL